MRQNTLQPQSIAVPCWEDIPSQPALLSRFFTFSHGGIHVSFLESKCILKSMNNSSCCFQPIWKICLWNFDHFPKNRDKNETYLKQPTLRLWCSARSVYLPLWPAICGLLCQNTSAVLDLTPFGIRNSWIQFCSYFSMLPPTLNKDDNEKWTNYTKIQDIKKFEWFPSNAIFLFCQNMENSWGCC